MTTIRERDAAWSDYRQSPDSLSPSADRRALLAAGDALAEEARRVTALTDRSLRLDFGPYARLRALAARWLEVTGER